MLLNQVWKKYKNLEGFFTNNFANFTFFSAFSSKGHWIWREYKMDVAYSKNTTQTVQERAHTQRKSPDSSAKSE